MQVGSLYFVKRCQVWSDVILEMRPRFIAIDIHKVARHAPQFRGYLIYYGLHVGCGYVLRIIVFVCLTQSLERVEVALTGQIDDRGFRERILDGVN